MINTGWPGAAAFDFKAAGFDFPSDLSILERVAQLSRGPVWAPPRYCSLKLGV